MSSAVFSSGCDMFWYITESVALSLPLLGVRTDSLFSLGCQVCLYPPVSIERLWVSLSISCSFTPVVGFIWSGPSETALAFPWYLPLFLLITNMPYRMSCPNRSLFRWRYELNTHLLSLPDRKLWNDFGSCYAVTRPAGPEPEAAASGHDWHQHIRTC